MANKKIIKKEIDELPDDVLDEVYKFISTKKAQSTAKFKIHTFNLHGVFDDLNVRSEAYD